MYNFADFPVFPYSCELPLDGPGGIPTEQLVKNKYYAAACAEQAGQRRPNIYVVNVTTQHLSISFKSEVAMSL